MAKRHNHYEAAFEDYLRARRIAYVAVDEQRRALEVDRSLKNVDFIVSPSRSARDPAVPPRWLVDVKGRRFPSGTANPQYWRNWTTADELDSLQRWSRRFGPDFCPVLVFAFHLVANRSPAPAEQVHYFRETPYAFLAVSAITYREFARPLSPRWGTVAMPVADFRRAARPVDEWIDAGLEPVPA